LEGNGVMVRADGRRPRGLAPTGVTGRFGPSPNGKHHRFWRGLFSGIWLIYLIQPLSTLFHHHYGVAYIAAATALALVFCVYYVWLIASWDGRRPVPSWTVAPLFVLAALACVVFGGANWNELWIFVSAASGLLIVNRRLAVRTVIAVAVSCAVFSWIGHDHVADFVIMMLPVAFVGFAMIGFKMQITLTRELSQARETVAGLAASEERLRLARDMHDLTGQSLSTITLKSELAARLLGRLPDSPERDRVRDEVEQVAAVSRQTLHDIREAISGYRKPTLAVEIITARNALESAGITAHDDPDLTMLSGSFDPDTEAALAWCLREAVTNVVRHSGARNCYLRLTKHAKTLSLEVADDGQPLAAQPSSPSSPSSPSPGTGLRGMSERLSAAGGQLELRPGADGFRLVASVPLRRATTPQSATVTA
jgi:two-component system sensor histidine kinase DesK